MEKKIVFATIYRRNLLERKRVDEGQTSGNVPFICRLLKDFSTPSRYTIKRRWAMKTMRVYNQFYWLGITGFFRKRNRGPPVGKTIVKVPYD